MAQARILFWFCLFAAVALSLTLPMPRRKHGARHGKGADTQRPNQRYFEPMAMDEDKLTEAFLPGADTQRPNQHYFEPMAMDVDKLTEAFLPGADTHRPNHRHFRPMTVDADTLTQALLLGLVMPSVVLIAISLVVLLTCWRRYKEELEPADTNEVPNITPGKKTLLVDWLNEQNRHLYRALYRKPRNPLIYSMEETEALLQCSCPSTSDSLSTSESRSEEESDSRSEEESDSRSEEDSDSRSEEDSDSSSEKDGDSSSEEEKDGNIREYLDNFTSYLPSIHCL